MPRGRGRQLRRSLSIMDKYLALIALVGVTIGIAAVLFWVYRRCVRGRQLRRPSLARDRAAPSRFGAGDGK
jgi:hypothetical protein